MALKQIALKLRAWYQIMRHFRNPLLVSAMRMGWLNTSIFPYRIAKGDCHYVMLGRPASVSHSDLSILREVLVEEEYQQVLALLPSGPLRLLDVGANLGSFTVWLHKRHGLREAYCFEPEPDSINLCRFNLANNGCEMATLIPKALGGQSREIEMWVDTNRPGTINIYGRPVGTARATKRVEVVASNEWLKELPGTFDLLKLDCEGAEWEIVRSTPPEILRRFSVVLAEIHEDKLQHSPVPQFRRLVEAAGFTTVRDDNKDQGLYIAVRKKASQ